MNPPSNSPPRQRLFALVALGCLALAVGYTVWATQRPGTVVNAEPAPMGTPIPIALPDDLAAVQSQPHLVVINREMPYIGQVKVVSLDSTSPKTAQTSLACDRVHYAGGQGLCLLRDTSAEGDVVLVTLFGADFQPSYKFTIEGYPSRTRVSPDGRYAAYTIFVTGHSYDDPNMSTATILLDTASGASVGNLEEFETWKNGRRYQAPEFNFWGVTFARDSNQFYATLRNGDTTYLVQGDVAARRLIVLRENVECPSLSPDNTRLAFKKRTLDGRWQLTVLNLATMQETPLAEEESVDDQMEWLDNQRILYQHIDPAPPPWMSVLMVPADGSGAPVVFAPNAISPAAVP